MYVSIHVVYFLLSCLTAFPCSDVENVPTSESVLKKQQEEQQRIDEETVLAAFAVPPARDDPVASVSGSKRLGSSRAAANKKSRSDGSSARYSLNEELYGYTIY